MFLLNFAVLTIESKSGGDRESFVEVCRTPSPHPLYLAPSFFLLQSLFLRQSRDLCWNPLLLRFQRSAEQFHQSLHRGFTILPLASGTLLDDMQDAIAADVFGSPGYVLDGEVFWGQDRIELLADALKSGRKAYTSEV